MMKKYLMVTGGVVSVALGSLGIVLPLLPTTPFLLLAAYLFSQSSEKFHDILMKNRILGKYIYNYTERKGIILRDKIISIITLWGGIAFSFTKMGDIYGRIFLLVVLLGVTYHLVTIETLES
jgi:uncharacterized membrane protein YbaN (DUF454 family)